ncbi:tripartite motif-containing protein 6/22/34 [Pelomyxa schiedti]|nr:tripartite motif-containing protein 6/22/34 [Pelomyxa schiedti]
MTESGGTTETTPSPPLATAPTATITANYVPPQCACCGAAFLSGAVPVPPTPSHVVAEATPPGPKRACCLSRADEAADNKEQGAPAVLLSPCGHVICASCRLASSGGARAALGSSDVATSESTRPDGASSCAANASVSDTHRRMGCGSTEHRAATGTPTESPIEAGATARSFSSSVVDKKIGYSCPACGCLVVEDKEDTLLMDVLALMDAVGCPVEIPSKTPIGDSMEVGDNTKSSAACIRPPTQYSLCDECMVNPATVWCEKEEIALCAECDKVFHSFRLTQSHVRVPIGNKPALKFREPKCKVHSGKDLTLWCEDDKELCCHICKESGNHRGHNISIRDDACRSNIENLLKTAREGADSIKSDESKASDLREASSKVKFEAEKIRLQIQTAFSNLHEALLKRESELYTRLETSKAELLDTLSRQTSDAVFSVAKSKVLYGSVVHTLNLPNTFTTLQAVPNKPVTRAMV